MKCLLFGLVVGAALTVGYYCIPPTDKTVHCIYYDTFNYNLDSNRLDVEWHDSKTNEYFGKRFELRQTARVFADDKYYISYKVGRLDFYDVQIHGIDTTKIRGKL